MLIALSFMPLVFQDESAASTVVTSEVVEDKNSKADKVPSSEKKDADRGPSAGPEVKDKPEQL